MRDGIVNGADHSVSFWEALHRNGQIIVALLKREAAARIRTPIDATLDILEPLLVICFFSFAIWLRNDHPIYGESTTLFLATGLFTHYLFAHCARRMRVTAPKGRFPAETMLDHTVVYVTWAVVDYALLALVLFPGLYIFASHEALPRQLLPLLEGVGSVVALGFGVAMANLSIRRVFPLWAYMFPIIARASMLGSGIHFIPDYLPPATRYILSFNPLQHSIQLFRLGFYPNYPHLTLDRTYLAWCCLVAVAAGLVIERFSRRREAQ